jgi:hypothetical protein
VNLLQTAAAACVISLASGCTVRTSAAPASVAAAPSPALGECAGGVVYSEADAQQYSACNVVIGDLKVQASALENMSAFSNLRRVQGALQLVDNPRLRSLAGLEQLEAVGELSISGSPVLEDLDGLARLGKAREVVLKSCRSLSDLTALGKLGELNELVIERTGVFTVAGLEGLSWVRELTIARNPKLISVAALNQLKAAGSIHIESNPRLAAQPGLFPALRRVENVVVKGNRGLSPWEVKRLKAKRSTLGGPSLPPPIASRAP